MKACPFCAEDILDTAVVCDRCNRAVDGTSDPRRSPWLWRAAVTVAAVFLLSVIGMLGSTHVRAKSTPHTVEAPAGQPIKLTDMVENVPADSWTAIPLNLPYSGVLQVQIGVERGNPLNVFVTTPDDMQAMRGDQVTTVRPYPGFAAATTKTFRREGKFAAGNYYLVLHDPSSGIPSSRASDVSVRADLRP